MSVALTTPVVLLVFNRITNLPAITKELRKAAPTDLYVVGDGPRKTVMSDAENCSQVIQLIRDEVDWPCQIHWNISQRNLGCKNRIVSGLDWVFDQCESAIILEDDCVPDVSFLFFCQELLATYRDNPEIGLISGNNFHSRFLKHKQDYYISRYPHIWGWATWRKTWQKYDASMSGWDGKLIPANFLGLPHLTPGEKGHWTRVFNLTQSGQIDTWDYQLTYCLWKYGLKSINPTRNLVTNLGFGEFASHTFKKNIFAEIPVQKINLPLTSPRSLRVSKLLDLTTGFVNFSDSTVAKVLRRIGFWIVPRS